MSFVNKLGGLVGETQTLCYAWSLLPNSFHLLLGIETIPLSTVMRRLITAYASTFNHKYKRMGPLFYNRYKSTVCEKEPYLLELVRYVHLRPLQAGVVKSLSELDTYRWTGHYVLINDSSFSSPGDFEEDILRPSRPHWQACDEALLFFSNEKEEARQLYHDFLNNGIKQGGKLESALNSRDEGAPSDARVLGSGEFVVRTLREAGESQEPKVKRISLQELCDKIRCHFNVDEEEMRSPIKKRWAVDAKAAFCYLAIRKMGYYGVEVGDYLNMQGFSANRAAERGKSILQNYGLNPAAFLNE
jgi:putative transposase